MAHLTQTKIRGQQEWRIVWHDSTRGAGRAGRRKVNCESGDHKDAFDAAELEPEQRAAFAAGATTKVLRERLRKCYEDLELQKAREAQRAAAAGVLPAFETRVDDVVSAYATLIKYRVCATTGTEFEAESVPDFGWRYGVTERSMSKAGGAEVLRTLKYFREWLPKGLTTGAMNGDHIRLFLAGTRVSRKLTPRSVNKYRGHLCAMFGAINRRARKKYFREDPTQWFAEDVEALKENQKEIVTHNAADLIAFLTAAEQRADPNRVVKVQRRKGGNGKIEEYEQEIGPDPAPVLEWAFLLTCTGMRRGEAERLRWADIDIEHGVIRVFASKTNAFRYVPLVGDPAGDVAPQFFAVLKAWRDQRPDDLFVLPSANGTPCFPKHAWDATAAQANVNITPQGLRRTFESMLAAVGFPASLAAFWLGHSVRVAENHYRAYRPGRLPGNTVEQALGLVPFLTREVRGNAKLRLLPKAVGDGVHGDNQ